MLFGIFYLNSDTLRNRGRSFLALVVYAAATIAVWVFYDFTQQYMTVSSVVSGVLLLLGMLACHSRVARRGARVGRGPLGHLPAAPRRADPRGRQDPQPKVSIHVPAYNEPPDMLIETLDALARLDYSNFEVLVIDNNTPDEAVWRPVEAHCATPRARGSASSTWPPLAGFKAGALNFALARTGRRMRRSSP